MTFLPAQNCQRPKANSRTPVHPSRPQTAISFHETPAIYPEVELRARESPADTRNEICHHTLGQVDLIHDGISDCRKRLERAEGRCEVLESQAKSLLDTNEELGDAVDRIQHFLCIAGGPVVKYTEAPRRARRESERAFNLKVPRGALSKKPE